MGPEHFMTQSGIIDGPSSLPFGNFCHKRECDFMRKVEKKACEKKKKKKKSLFAACMHLILAFVHFPFRFPIVCLSM